MSNWLDEKAEELINDPIVPSNIKALAKHYMEVKARLAQAASCDTTASLNDDKISPEEKSEFFSNLEELDRQSEQRRNGYNYAG